MSYWYGYGFGRGRGRGGGFGGRGNPSPYCRWYPNMPRGWWRMPTSYWEQKGITPMPAPGVPPAPSVFMAGNEPVTASDKESLQAYIETLEAQLKALKQRLTELEKEI